jgi:hypothetical protein
LHNTTFSNRSSIFCVAAFPEDHGLSSVFRSFLFTMPVCSRLVLSFCVVSGCAIGCSSSFILPTRTALSPSSISIPTLNVPSSSHRITWRLFGRKGVDDGKKETKPSKSNLPEKICVVCGRPFTWRKKWERCWDEVTCCSKSCNAQRRSSGGGGGKQCYIRS